MFIATDLVVSTDQVKTVLIAIHGNYKGFRKSINDITRLGNCKAFPVSHAKLQTVHISDNRQMISLQISSYNVQMDSFKDKRKREQSLSFLQQ